MPEPPAPGWAELMQRCWADAPDARPAFEEVVQQLEDMLRAAKAARQAAQQEKAAAVRWWASWLGMYVLLCSLQARTKTCLFVLYNLPRCRLVGLSIRVLKAYMSHAAHTRNQSTRAHSCSRHGLPVCCPLPRAVALRPQLASHSSLDGRRRRSAM